MKFSALLCLLITVSLLGGCVSTSSYLAKMNKIRDRNLPEVEKQVAAAHFELGAPLYLRIFKKEGTLEAWMQDRNTGLYNLYKSYPICTYSGGLGPKLREGDKQSPEGFYDIIEDRLWPGSQYHLAMNIGFPNEYDISHGRTGSYLMIHGGCKSDGCYAMTNKVIEEIYLLTEQSILAGNTSVPVHIFPFRMTHQNMVQYMDQPWTKFWLNLKQGYDLFERNYTPPIVQVSGGRYIFMDYYTLAQNQYTR